MDTFNFVPYSNRVLTHTALNRRIEFENGNEQVQRQSVNPKVIWELNFSGLYDEMLSLKSFFDSHAPGGITFYWTDESKVQHIVRFANDELKFDQYYGLDDKGFGVKSYKCTIQFRKVWQ